MENYIGEAVLIEFKRTDGKNKDFVENCRLLDMDLDRRVGKNKKREIREI